MSDLTELRELQMGLKGEAYDFTDENLKYCQELLGKLKNMVDISDPRDVWAVSMFVTQFGEIMNEVEDNVFEGLKRGDECESDVSDI